MAGDQADAAGDSVRRYQPVHHGPDAVQARLGKAGCLRRYATEFMIREGHSRSMISTVPVPWFMFTLR